MFSCDSTKFYHESVEHLSFLYVNNSISVKEIFYTNKKSCNTYPCELIGKD